MDFNIMRVMLALWLKLKRRMENARFVGYYENSGEFMGHYVAWLKEWAGERRASFGGHFVPHDGDRESLWLEGGTKGVMSSLGFHPTCSYAGLGRGGTRDAARVGLRPRSPACRSRARPEHSLAS
jgi:hypothetical protein